MYYTHESNVVRAEAHRVSVGLSTPTDRRRVVCRRRGRCCRESVSNSCFQYTLRVRFVRVRISMKSSRNIDLHTRYIGILFCHDRADSPAFRCGGDYSAVDGDNDGNDGSKLKGATNMDHRMHVTRIHRCARGSRA